MKIFVDMDETICYYPGEREYPKALPIEDRIQRINELHDSGHEITYYTARGVTSGLDWNELTVKQLKEWGCKYHNVSVGEKPDYDLLICDKAVTSDFFFSKLSEKINAL
jgi:hypothetical protein